MSASHPPFHYVTHLLFFGATPRHYYIKEKENGWPRSQTAERKTSPNTYVLGDRRRQTKEGEAKEDMTKHLQRRPTRRDGCQLAWSPPDRQWPWWMDHSRCPMLREEQADLNLSKSIIFTEAILFFYDVVKVVTARLSQVLTRLISWDRRWRRPCRSVCPSSRWPSSDQSTWIGSWHSHWRRSRPSVRPTGAPTGWTTSSSARCGHDTSPWTNRRREPSIDSGRRWWWTGRQPL